MSTYRNAHEDCVRLGPWPWFVNWVEICWALYPYFTHPYPKDPSKQERKKKRDFPPFGKNADGVRTNAGLSVKKNR